MPKNRSIRPPKLIIAQDAATRIYIRPPKIWEKPRDDDDEENVEYEILENAAGAKGHPVQPADIIVLAEEKPKGKRRVAPGKGRPRSKGSVRTAARNKTASGSARSGSGQKPAKVRTPPKAGQAAKAAPRKSGSRSRAKKKPIGPAKMHPPRIR